MEIEKNKNREWTSIGEHTHIHTYIQTSLPQHGLQANKCKKKSHTKQIPKNMEQGWRSRNGLQANKLKKIEKKEKQIPKKKKKNRYRRKW